MTIGWPDPERSAPAIAALLGLQQAASTSASARIDLAGLMRSATTDMDPEAADQALDKGALALPVAEQSVWAHNAMSDDLFVAAYSGAPGSSLDYPLVVTNSASRDHPGRRRPARRPRQRIRQTPPSVARIPQPWPARRVLS